VEPDPPVRNPVGVDPDPAVSRNWRDDFHVVRRGSARASRTCMGRPDLLIGGLAGDAPFGYSMTRRRFGPAARLPRSEAGRPTSDNRQSMDPR
jgi:hypothetical protein